MAQVELPAELQHRLVWLVAAALRHYIVQQHGVAAVDGADRGGGSRAGRRAMTKAPSSRRWRCASPAPARARPARRCRARTDLGEGMLPLFIAGLAALSGLDQTAAWEVLADPRGRGPALLLRAAGVEREAAAAILLLANSRGPLVSGAEGDAAAEQLELLRHARLPRRREVLRLWQAASGLSRQRRPPLDPRPPAAAEAA